MCNMVTGLWYPFKAEYARCTGCYFKSVPVPAGTLMCFAGHRIIDGLLRDYFRGLMDSAGQRITITCPSCHNVTESAISDCSDMFSEVFEKAFGIGIGGRAPVRQVQQEPAFSPSSELREYIDREVQREIARLVELARRTRQEDAVKGEWRIASPSNRLALPEPSELRRQTNELMRELDEIERMPMHSPEKLRRLRKLNEELGL